MSQSESKFKQKKHGKAKMRCFTLYNVNNALPMYLYQYCPKLQTCGRRNIEAHRNQEPYQIGVCCTHYRSGEIFNKADMTYTDLYSKNIKPQIFAEGWLSLYPKTMSSKYVFQFKSMWGSSEIAIWTNSSFKRKGPHVLAAMGVYSITEYFHNIGLWHIGGLKEFILFRPYCTYCVTKWNFWTKRPVSSDTLEFSYLSISTEFCFIIRNGNMSIRCSHAHRYVHVNIFILPKPLPSAAPNVLNHKTCDITMNIS